MQQPDPITSLTELGFTPLEAQTYTFILQNAGVTGYRVAQALGKAAANVYKAIEALESKGAIIVERDTHRRLRAVPPAELFDQLERTFLQRRERAEQALAQIPDSPEDDSVYQLSSWSRCWRASRPCCSAASTMFCWMYRLSLYARSVIGSARWRGAAWTSCCAAMRP